MPTITDERAAAARNLAEQANLTFGLAYRDSWEGLVLRLTADLARNGWFAHEQASFKDAMVHLFTDATSERKVRKLLAVWDAYTAWDKAAD